MNRLGIESLNAGAPDMRLTGDQRPTYTQRRRTQMAGGGIMGSNAGSMLVAPTADGSRPGYGWLSDIKDKFVDDIIPNEIKNPAALATIAGVGLNQFGLPNIPGMGKIGLEQGMGQNWLGELLGNVVPGGTVDTVIGQGGSGQTLGTGVSNIWDAITGTPTEYSTTRPSGIDAAVKTMTGGGINPLDANWQEILKQQAASKLPGMIAGPVEGILGADRGKFAQFQDLAKNIIPSQDDKGWLNTLFGDTTRPVGGGGQDVFNWKIPVAGGLAAGAYTAAQPRDVHPEDKTSIDFKTARQYMDDPKQRFKPKEIYADTAAMAAEGGRIGYDDGGITSGIDLSDFRDKIFSDEARALAGNIPEVRARGGEYLPTLFEEEEGGKYKYPGDPRPGQEYLTSTLQGANTMLDEMEMQKLRLTELASEQGLDFNDLFERELNRITGAEGPATKDITKIRDKERILKEIEWKLKENVYAQDGTFQSQGETFKLRTPMGKKKLSSYAHGGRIGYADGTPEVPEEFLEDLKRKDLHKFLDKYRRFQEDYERRKDLAPTQEVAGGGRIGYEGGSGSYSEYAQAMNALGQTPMPIGIFQSLEGIMSVQEMVNMGSPGKAQGGRIGAQEGGLMDLGGMEKDYRDDGGFVPLGGEEKADDVPARLSKNEFVFTADAVRNAGDGDIDAGAEVMENLMKHLEAGGEVSEDSQGLEGARDMFANAQQLEKRII